MGRAADFRWHAARPGSSEFVGAVIRFEANGWVTRYDRRDPLRAFADADSIREALDALFRPTVEYTRADASHLGCLLGNVGPATALPDVRRFLRANLAMTEERIAERLSAAVQTGELPSDLDQ